KKEAKKEKGKEKSTKKSSKRKETGESQLIVNGRKATVASLMASLTASLMAKALKRLPLRVYVLFQQATVFETIKPMFIKAAIPSPA
ncbi:hypothetical protein BG003_010119, partial [Podila horticola]